MAQTRAMTAARRSTASITAAQVSKPVGIAKKKAAAATTKPKPKPKPAPIRTTTTRRAGKRKASEIEDEAPVPVPRAKRAKATPVVRKPTKHRYGTRSNQLAATPPPPSPSSPVPLPVPAPAAPAPALPTVLLSPSMERGPLQLTPFVTPFSSPIFSGARLSPLVVERGGPLSPPDLSDEKKLRTLGGFRALGKQKKGSKRPVLKPVVGIGYLGVPRSKKTEQDPLAMQARLEAEEQQAYWKKDQMISELKARREREAVRGYEVVYAKRSLTYHRLFRRTDHKGWCTPWKKQLIPVRRLELARRARSGRKWETHQVHKNSPLAEDCSAALEEEARLFAVHEQRFLARERFDAELQAGDVEDADEYGEDYDPFEEDY